MTSSDDRKPLDAQEKWARLVADTRGAPTRSLSAESYVAASKRPQPKVDGRSLRKTGRTEQFNVRLKADTKLAIQRLADENDWLIGEVIEHAIAALTVQLHKP